MSHEHPHTHGTHRIKWAFWINLVFSLIELVGGLFVNSISILSDALHDLGDSLSLGLAWYFQNMSHKHKDSVYTYGYQRFSILGALVNAVILLTGSILILAVAIPRLMNPPETNSTGMFWIAILGLVFNGLAFFKLSHGHSHNEQVVSLHFLEDILGWVAVLVGSVIIYYTGWFIIDPILSVAIACFIIFNVFRHLKASWRIFLQGIPPGISLDSIREVLINRDDLESYHDLHVWSLDGEKGILTVHLVIHDHATHADRRNLKNAIQEQMRNLGIHHCTIEMELSSEACEMKTDCL